MPFLVRGIGHRGDASMPTSTHAGMARPHARCTDGQRGRAGLQAPPAGLAGKAPGRPEGAVGAAAVGGGG
eukprot:7833408-Alexandrium_andersonii.AAC.1